MRDSAAALASIGVRIRFLHSTLVPEDEAAFCVFDAESPAVIEEAYALAGVPYERVLDALEIAVNRDAPPATPADERSIDVQQRLSGLVPVRRSLPLSG